jgi:hypothetical protein
MNLVLGYDDNKPAIRIRGGTEEQHIIVRWFAESTQIGNLCGAIVKWWTLHDEVRDGIENYTLIVFDSDAVNRDKWVEFVEQVEQMLEIKCE